ncbi:methyl-accepting chemotaxis protein [Gorillibacterium sp. sgz5001074]|uniref:methyl-accepting chemotaxis protein n=1 Tax=Gorillibacterium sp. sgz5001074 TaxID=3446695 RepID=UPI003F67A661
MFKFIRNRSLKAKLLASFAVVLLIPGFLIGYLSYETARNKVGDQLLNSAEENVALLDQIITETISSRMKDMNYLAFQLRQSDLQGKDLPVQRYLDGYKELHPEINTIFVGTPSGGFVNAPHVKMADDFDARKRPWYLDAMKDSSKLAVTAPYVSKTTGDFVIALSKVLNDGSGVVGAEIKLKDLEVLTKGVKIGERGYAMLLDQNKKVIVNQEMESGSDVQADWVAAAYGSQKGDIRTDVGASVKRILFDTNALTGWKIGGVIEEKELAEQAAPILNRMLMVLLVAMVLFGTLAVVIVWFITKPLQELAGVAGRISEGDLTIRARVRSADEIGRLGSSFNAMADSLRTLLGQIGELSMQVAASSQELTASAEQTSKATEQIAGSVQEVATGAEGQVKSVSQGFSSIRGMADGISRILQGSQEVRKSSEEASAYSGEGSETMSEAIGRMGSVRGQVGELEQVMKLLDERSAAIGQIAEVMTGIAQQTNILSINASIEASRAGEQGRGFAVVALEVKKLAEQSRVSAEQIRDMIGMVQAETLSAVRVTEAVVSGVTEGSDSIRRAGDLFGNIKSGLEQVVHQAKSMNEAVNRISDESGIAVEAMEQVSAATDVTADHAQNVSAAAEEQLAAMEEIAASSAALARMAEDMQLLIGRFKV